MRNNGPEIPGYGRGGDGPPAPYCSECYRYHWNWCPPLATKKEEWNEYTMVSNTANVGGKSWVLRTPTCSRCGSGAATYGTVTMFPLCATCVLAEKDETFNTKAKRWPEDRYDYYEPAPRSPSLDEWEERLKKIRDTALEEERRISQRRQEKSKPKKPEAPPKPKAPENPLGARIAEIDFDD